MYEIHITQDSWICNFCQCFRDGEVWCVNNVENGIGKQSSKSSWDSCTNRPRKAMDSHLLISYGLNSRPEKASNLGGQFWIKIVEKAMEYNSTIFCKKSDINKQFRKESNGKSWSPLKVREENLNDTFLTFYFNYHFKQW